MEEGTHDGARWQRHVLRHGGENDEGVFENGCGCGGMREGLVEEGEKEGGIVTVIYGLKMGRKFFLDT